MTSIRVADSRDIEACVVVLASLPAYFTPSTHDELRMAMSSHRAWVATHDDAVIGFALAQRRYLRAAEITFAAVLPDHQAAGIGTQLIDYALRELAEDGVGVVQVKTLDVSANYEPYVATRAFWERRGFVQIDCIDPLPGWQPGTHRPST